jgi:hypothetical protein
MGKVQKTLQFHEEVARLVQAYADKKGTNFQRVVQAAVLQFFFSDVDGPDERWMTAFVELEKGAGDPPLDLATLPIRYYEHRAAQLEVKLARLRQKYAAKPPKTPEHAKHRDATIATFENHILWYHSEAGVWRTGVELHGGGVDGAIEQAIASGSDERIFIAMRGPGVVVSEGTLADGTKVLHKEMPFPDLPIEAEVDRELEEESDLEERE